MDVNNRILIISPNLEPGYCGVSDYVFVLQSFFINDAFDCALLALSDKYCSDIKEDENSLRIPFTTKSNTKLKLANDFITFFNPGTIYFNLVSYGYHKKGLPFYLLQFLPHISKNYKLVIIAHELWAGNFKDESVNNKVLGKIQSILFTSLFRKLHQTEIVVTTGIAKNILKNYKLNTRIVPVFNNIPIAKYETQSISNSYIKLVFFGASLFKISYSSLVKFLINLSTKYGKKIQIDIVGRNNSTLVDWDKIASHFINDNLLIVKHGFISAKKISHLMQESTIGITTYMPFFWGKSGAIAAMLAHGLPVVSITDEITIDRFTNNIPLNPRIWSISQLMFDDHFDELRINKVDFDYNQNIFNQLISKLNTI